MVKLDCLRRFVWSCLVIHLDDSQGSRPEVQHEKAEGRHGKGLVWIYKATFWVMHTINCLHVLVFLLLHSGLYCTPSSHNPHTNMYTLCVHTYIWLFKSNWELLTPTSSQVVALMWETGLWLKWLNNKTYFETCKLDTVLDWCLIPPLCLFTRFKGMNIQIKSLSGCLSHH